MQNEFDKYKNSQPEVFFWDEFSPFSDKEKGRGGVQLVPRNFLGKLDPTHPYLKETQLK
jgi:hypothetical protein